MIDTVSLPASMKRIRYAFAPSIVFPFPTIVTPFFAVSSGSACVSVIYLVMSIVTGPVAVSAALIAAASEAVSSAV